MTQTERDTDTIALVGAGERGRAILEALLDTPGIEVRFVFDTDPDAPATALARVHGIACRTDGHFDELAAGAGIDLVLDTTGEPQVHAALLAAGRPDTLLLDAAGLRLIERLIGVAGETAARLERQIQACEERVAHLTEVVERVPTEKACYVRQASHQIKSPLSSIQTYVNVILGGYAGEIPDRARDIVQKIHGRCDAALGALAKCRRLADLRCVSADAVEMSDVSLGELVNQAVEMHAERAAGRGIEVGFSPCDGPDLVRCDRATMLTLFSELVENAVIYSHDGGVVEIAVTRQADGRLVVSVRDHGIGIPERCLPRVFDEDYRADPAKKHHPDGAGLGLTIAREIADLHQVDLAVESEEGSGSVFTAVFPPTPTA